MLPILSPSRAVYENTHQNTGNQAADLVSVALSQMGYTDSANGVQEYSKYGDWYGIPTGYWCAMFVSWCADQAGISSRVLPPFSSCTLGMRTFQSMGRWQNGPRLGGTYTPKMGDLVFYDWYGNDNLSNHVGIVLYCEDGWLYTVEGNTLANRLDQPEVYETSTEPVLPYVPDIVMVRAHRLDSIYILGYAVPNYAGAAVSAPPLQGYVDIPLGTEMAPEIQRVVDAGLMAPMSSHTFGPMYGITRGEYVTALANYLGLNSYTSDTTPFLDLPQEHPAYNAVMAFRSAGILTGAGNYVYPDEYITVAAAQTILDRVYALFGESAPDMSYVGRARDGYLQRYEAAHALCVLMDRARKPLSTSTYVALDCVLTPLDTMQYSGVNYATAEDWQQLLSAALAARSSDEAAASLGPAPEFPFQTSETTDEDAEASNESAETSHELSLIHI